MKQNHQLIRVYLAENDNKLDPIMDYLHNDIKIKGATVFRGISGFGDTGQIHSSNFTELSLNLPLVIEFFDEMDKIKQAVSHLQNMSLKGHIVSFAVDIF